MNETEQLKVDILSNFDFAFKIDWENSHHRKIHKYLNALTIYCNVKFNGHIAEAGSFLAYRFANRSVVQNRIEMFRSLFKNESSNFTEEICNGCHIFTF
jgi:hypothetical protein